MRTFWTRLLSAILAPSTATRVERRALGGAILFVVVAMVIVGFVYLEAGLSPGTSLLFWGICLLFMVWSIFLAYLDVKSIRADFRAQKKKLLLSAFSREGLEEQLRKKGAKRPQSPKGRRAGR